MQYYSYGEPESNEYILIQTDKAIYKTGQTAGAMRIPNNHYLTKHYIDLFNIRTVPFKNYSDRGYLYIYGEKITMKDWRENNGHYSDKWWPGWDHNLTQEIKENLNIKGILDLYARTVEPVKTELLADHSERGWHDWIDKWSELSLEDFLRGDKYQCENGNKVRPWPEAAIEAYTVSTYKPQSGMTMASILRKDLGQWWKDPSYRIDDGMDTLPKAFLDKNIKGWNQDVDLSKHIKFGIQVEKVLENKTATSKSVTIKGKNVESGKKEEFVGDAVILTVPLHILREIDAPLSVDKQKAMTNVNCIVATKIFLQCKTRFWIKQVGQGGYTMTDLEIGQLHYPDYGDSGMSADERGILMVYSWGENALTFGSMDPQQAIDSAVKQISKIHPEIIDQFEVGTVKSWSCAGAFLKPSEYISNMHILTTTLCSDTIFLAGETLCWSNSWIQGAIYSGLMQAFAVQHHVQTDVEHRKVDQKEMLQKGGDVTRPAFHPTRILLSE